MKFAVLFFTVVFVALLILVWIAPKVERVEGSTEIQASPDRVWKTWMAVGRQMAWRRDLKEVRLIAGTQSGPARWVEILRNGDPINFKTENLQPNSFWRISFESEAMRGNWTGRLQSVAPGITRVSIEEAVEIHSPIARALFHWTSGLEKFAMSYLAGLKSVSESVE